MTRERLNKIKEMMEEYCTIGEDEYYEILDELDWATADDDEDEALDDDIWETAREFERLKEKIDEYNSEENVRANMADDRYHDC